MYCGTHGLLKDIPLSRVLEFEKEFLTSINLAHKQDVLKPLKQGIMNDDIGKIIETIAVDVIKSMLE